MVVFEQAIAFSEANPKYRCCFRGYHVTAGALMVASLELFALFPIVVGSVLKFFAPSVGPSENVGLIVSVVICAICAVVYALLFVGVAREKKTYLLPYLILSVICVLRSAAWATLMLIGYLTENAGLLKVLLTYGSMVFSVDQNQFIRPDDGPSKIAIYALVAVIVAWVIAAVLYLWFFLRVLSCYRYFSEKYAFGNGINGVQYMAHMAYIPKQAYY